MYLAVFNVDDGRPINVRVDWRSLKLPSKCRLRDLWEHQEVGVFDGGYSFPVAPHASGLYKVTGAN